MYKPQLPLKIYIKGAAALLYITTKESLESRALINFICHKSFVALRPIMIYGQINNLWPTAIHDLSENNVHGTLNKHSTVGHYSMIWLKSDHHIFIC